MDPHNLLSSARQSPEFGCKDTTTARGRCTIESFTILLP